MVLAILVLALRVATTSLFDRATFLEGLQQEQDIQLVKRPSMDCETWGLTH